MYVVHVCNVCAIMYVIILHTDYLLTFDTQIICMQCYVCNECAILYIYVRVNSCAVVYLYVCMYVCISSAISYMSVVYVISATS